MKTIKQGTLQDGTNIYLEDWQSQKYWFKFVVSAYPIAKLCGSGYFAPKNSDRIRIGLNFSTKEEAQTAFSQILNGNKSLKDFEAYAENKKYFEKIKNFIEADNCKLKLSNEYFYIEHKLKSGRIYYTTIKHKNNIINSFIAFSKSFSVKKWLKLYQPYFEYDLEQDAQELKQILCDIAYLLNLNKEEIYQ